MGNSRDAIAGWVGDWNADKSVFTGTYTDQLGKTFVGTASWVSKHVITHRTPDDYVKVVEMPVAPHWEFTGEHGCDPLPPDDRQFAQESGSGPIPPPLPTGEET